MTRREWMVEHHPDCVGKIYGGSSVDNFVGGVIGCPHDYPDLPRTGLCDHAKSCEICWTREVPVTGEAESAEIISDLKDID